MGVCAEMCADQHAITRDQQVVFPSKWISWNFARFSLSYFINLSPLLLQLSWSISHDTTPPWTFFWVRYVLWTFFQLLRILSWMRFDYFVLLCYYNMYILFPGLLCHSKLWERNICTKWWPFCLGDSSGMIMVHATLKLLITYAVLLLWFSINTFCFLQVEIFSGRGKPSTLVDKDEGLGKVNRLIQKHVNYLECTI